MSNKKVYIIGGGGHAKVIYSILKESGYYEYNGFVDKIKNNNLSLYIGSDDYIIKNRSFCRNIVIGVSYVKNIYDGIRKGLINKYIRYSEFNFPNIISNNCIIDNDVKLGKGNVLVHGAIVNIGVEINDFCIINTNATVDHDCKIDFNTQIGPGATILGGVEIGKNVFVGAGSVILDGLKIGDDIIIGAGSLVRKDIQEKGVYAGNPLRKIR